MNKPINTQVPPYRLNEVKPNSFIFEIENALTADICQEIIERFETNHDQQYVGRIGQGAEQDASIKQSTDLAVSGKENWKDIDQMFFRSAALAVRTVREHFPFFHGPFKDVGYNIQRTKPGQYYHWHIDGGSHDFADRQLVLIWYLNDVGTDENSNGGETEFSLQNVKITPKAGKMVLFPPFWTHEHRGVQLESGVKYIATTWIVFG
jgi:Rps23 Pro-64 3,4-dihydroxylase Tpa1-like proline 4-hydroxylase